MTSSLIGPVAHCYKRHQSLLQPEQLQGCLFQELCVVENLKKEEKFRRSLTQILTIQLALRYDAQRQSEALSYRGAKSWLQQWVKQRNSGQCLPLWCTQNSNLTLSLSTPNQQLPLTTAVHKVTMFRPRKQLFVILYCNRQKPLQQTARNSYTHAYIVFL